MPTQAELDRGQERTRARSGTIGTVRRGGIHDIDTQPRQDDNKEGTDERIANDGIDTITSPIQGDDDSGGDGLPEFPGEEPGINIKAPLVWDGDEGEARWLQGETQPLSDPKTYADVMIYQPLSTADNFTLLRTEFLEVIICKDGEPVTGNIFFVEADPQP